MESQKDEEVLNLFYLFNEGDLYKVAGEQQPLLQPLPSSELTTAGPVPASVPQQVQKGAVTHSPADEEVMAAQTPLAASAVSEKPVQQPLSNQPLPASTSEPLPPKGVPMAKMTPTPEPPVATVSLKPFHPVLIVVREHRAPLLEAQDEAFLEKVLQAVGLSLAQVTVVNVHQIVEPDYYYLFKEKTVRQFISFGVPMEELNLYLDLPPYEVKSIHGIRFLSTDSLEGIRTDVERKRGLWAALKQMFNA
jgi:hypothetical protein